MNRRSARLPAVLVVLLLVVAGCTGVPGSSSPQPVRTMGLGESPAPSAPAPPKGASPRQIVQGFLEAMATSPDRLDSARAFLDSEAAQKWSGSTVTVVEQRSLVVSSDPQPDNSIGVSYQPVGTLSAAGVYRPATAAALGVGAAQTATYALVQNGAGEWRIANPVPAGLFIGDADFARLFTPQVLYFLNSAGTKLVPDLRYSSLAEPALETFLLAQLAAGPRQELEPVVSPFEPQPAGNQRLGVTVGSPTEVQIPGAAALDGPARRQLAAQVAFTLRPSTSFASRLTIKDGTQTVTIPNVGAVFDSSAFDDLAPVDDASVSASYVRGGAVVDANGVALSGAYGQPSYALDSAVLDGDGGRILVAGTSGPDGDTGQRRLLVGDASKLTDVGVPPGPLSTPAWAPVGTRSDVDEVWVASGGQLFRYRPGSGQPPATVNIGGQTAITGTILSLAFSPEGSRVVLVIRSADGTGSQVWLASVSRNGPDVQLGQPEQVTPSGYVIADAGWRSETLLAAVGTSATYPNGVYLDVQTDGSRLTASPTDPLTDRPRALAVSPWSGQQWVSTGTGAEAEVWSRGTSLGAWTSPAGASTTPGSAPSFSR